MPEPPLLKLKNASTIDDAEIPTNDICRCAPNSLADVERGWGYDTMRMLRDLNRQGFRVVLSDHSSDPEAVAEHFRFTGQADGDGVRPRHPRGQEEPGRLDSREQ